MMHGSLNIIPYGKLNGAWTLTDAEVCGLFARIAREGLDRWVFLGGPVRSAREFVGMMQGGNRMFAVTDRDVIKGIFWLNNMMQKHCQVHFCVFREAWGRLATSMGKHVLNYLLQTRAQEGQYLFDCVLGPVPEHNAMAMAFASRVGMRLAGRVPGMIFDHHLGRSVAACLFYATREG